MTADHESACAFERAASALVTLTGCSVDEAAPVIRRSWLAHHRHHLDAMSWLTSMYAYLIEARAVQAIPQHRRSQLRVLPGGAP